MQAKAKASPKKISKTDAGSVATPENDSPQKQGKKRSAAEAEAVVNGAAADSPKRHKQVEAGDKEAVLQVCRKPGHCSRDLQHRTPAEILCSLMSFLLLFFGSQLSMPCKAGESILSWLIQVKDTEPNSVEKKSAVPEADTISAAAAMDPPVGSETGKTTKPWPQ